MTTHNSSSKSRVHPSPSRPSVGTRPRRVRPLPLAARRSDIPVATPLPLLLLTLFLLTSSAFAQLPESLLVEGSLLAQTQVTEGLHLGLYGPQTVTKGEPDLVSVVLLGNQTTRISYGYMLMAYDHGAVHHEVSPPPAGWYIPPGQWSPDRESEWRQLLLVNPRSLWATHMVAMAHVRFQGGAGELLDSVVFKPDIPEPDAKSPFRCANEFDQIGIAFLVDESINNTRALDLEPDSRSTGAHGLKLSFPIVVNDPAASLQLWLAARVNDRFVSASLTAEFTPPHRTKRDEAPIPDTPTIFSPKPGAILSATASLRGNAKPGALAVGWVELIGPGDPAIRIEGKRARYITGDNGGFEIPILLPPLGDYAAADFIARLHVRAEAPGYKSPEATVDLKLR